MKTGTHVSETIKNVQLLSTTALAEKSRRERDTNVTVFEIAEVVLKLS